MTQTPYAAEIIETQKKRIQTLEHELTWTKELMANPTMSPADKCILWATTPEPIKRGLPFDYEQAQQKKVYIAGMAEQVGISPGTFGPRLERLAEQGEVFTYKREREPAQDGTPVLRVYLAPMPLLSTPNAIKLPPKGQGHGGKRTKRCNACGSENLVEKRQMICADCGTLQCESIHIVNMPDGPIRQDDLSLSQEKQGACCLSNNFSLFRLI